MGEEQSAPSADNLAAPVAEMRLLSYFIKVGESADRFAASKVSLIRDIDALLSLVGEIIHRESECWKILTIKLHGNGHFQSRCARKNS